MGSRCLQIPLKELCLADGIPGIAGSAGSAGIGCFTDYPAWTYQTGLGLVLGLELGMLFSMVNKNATEGNGRHFSVWPDVTLVIKQFSLTSMPHFKKTQYWSAWHQVFYYYVNEDKIPLVGTVC